MKIIRVKEKTYTSALRDLIAFYDRVAGNVHTGHGWTPAEIKRLQEIRDLADRPPQKTPKL